MYRRIPGILLGFHGCERDVAEHILAGRDQLKPSSAAWDWLGDGIYFWESSPARALYHASNKRNFPRIKNPFVLGAVIDPGHCLNLLDLEYLELVRHSHAAFSRMLDHLGQQMPKNEPGRKQHYLDREVINWINAELVECGQPPFDSVRAAYQEGAPVYPDGFPGLSHIHLCIRNPQAIKGYFRPMKLNDDGAVTYMHPPQKP